jgi:serine/threonine protein phosphatase PrpC
MKKKFTGLLLDTKKKSYDEEGIEIIQSSSSSYSIVNHPKSTDLTDTPLQTSQKYGQMFFAAPEPKYNQDDCAFHGEFYYILQRSNGKEMQDKCKANTYIEDTPLSVFGVYDGHSTKLIAELLANRLDEYILLRLKARYEILPAIKDAFKQIESEVMMELEKHKPRGGSTALCAVFYNKSLYIANVGDSRAVLFQRNGFISLSAIHDCYNQFELDDVEKRGGTILKNRIEGELALTRSIGDINFKQYMSSEPEIISHEITENDDFLLLGSDGFWNGLDPNLALEKINEFRENKMADIFDIEELSNFLIEEASKGMKTKKDNVTLITISMRDMFKKNTFCQI